MKLKSSKKLPVLLRISRRRKPFSCYEMIQTRSSLSIVGTPLITHTHILMQSSPRRMLKPGTLTFSTNIASECRKRSSRMAHRIIPLHHRWQHNKHPYSSNRLSRLWPLYRFAHRRRCNHRWRCCGQLGYERSQNPGEPNCHNGPKSWHRSHIRGS